MGRRRYKKRKRSKDEKEKEDPKIKNSTEKTDKLNSSMDDIFFKSELRLRIITVYGVEESYSEIQIKIPLPGIQKHPRKLIKVEFDIRSVEVRVKDLNEANFFFKAYYLAHNIVPEKSKHIISKDLLVLRLEKVKKEMWFYVHYHHPNFLKIFEKNLETFMTAHFSVKPHETLLQQLRHCAESFIFSDSDLTDYAIKFEVTLPELISCENDVDKTFEFMKQKISRPSTSMKELYYFTAVLFTKERLDFEQKFPHLSQENMLSDYKKMKKVNVSFCHLSGSEEYKEEGNAFFKAKLYHRAIISYNKAINLDPNNAIYFLNRGIAHFHLREINLCIYNAIEALIRNPFYSKAYLYLGKSYLLLCCPSKAAACLNRAKGLDFCNRAVKDETLKLDQLKKNINLYVSAVKDENHFLRSIILKEIAKTSILLVNVQNILIEELCRMNLLELAKREANLIHLNLHPLHKDAGFYMLGLCSFYENNEFGVHSNFKESLKISETFKGKYEDIKFIFAIRRKGNESYKKGNFQEAIDICQKGLDETVQLPCTVHASFLYKISCAKFRLHKHREGLQYLEKAIMKYPDYHEALSARGEYFVNEGKFQRALEDFEKASKIFPCNNYVEKIRKVRQLQTRYQPTQRTELWRDNIRDFISISQMEYAEHRKMEGNKLFESQRFEDALQEYTEAINIDPGNAIYYSNRAAVYIILKKFKNALEDCKAALRINPLLEKGLLRYSKCSIILGYLNDAVRLFELAYQHNPNRIIINSEYLRLKKLQEMVMNGKRTMYKKEYKRAGQYFSEAISEANMCVEFHLKKIECLLLSENYKDAITASKFAISLNLEDSDLYYYMGLCFIYEDERLQAKEYIAKATNLNPNNDRLFNIIDKILSIFECRELGNEAYAENRFTDALACYEKALNKLQTDFKLKAIFHNNIGMLFMKEDNIKNAILNFTSAIEFQADYVKAYTNRAKCYLKLNQIDEAINDYEEVNKILPCNKHKELIQVAKNRLESGVEQLDKKYLEEIHSKCQPSNEEKYFSEDRFGETIKCYIESSVLARYSLQLFKVISNCHLEMGNINKGVETLKKARMIDCNNIDINKGIVKCFELKKKLEVATKIDNNQSFSESNNSLESMSEVNVDNSLFFSVGESLIHQYQFNVVETLLESIPDKLIETANVYCIKGMYSYYQKDDNTDLVYFQKSLELDPLNETAKIFKNRIELVYNKKRMGDDSYLQQNYTDALKYYEECLQLVPENNRMLAKLYHNIGAMYMNQKKFNKAISSFTEAISFKTDYIKALEKRAKCYKQLNQLKKAIKEYEKLFDITLADKYEAHIKELENLLKRSNQNNYYYILGVSATASMEDIRKAYKRLAMEFHPDKLMADNKGEGEERFKDISKAYSVLSDPIKRERYDRGERENDNFTSFPQPFMPDSFSRMFFEMFANQNFRSDDQFNFS